MAKTPEEKLAEVDAAIADCHERIKPIHKELDRLIKRQDKLRNAIDQSKAETMNDDIDWEWLLSVHPESQTKYKLRDETIYSLGGMMASGYFPETNQSAITIMLDYNDEESIKTVQKSIETLLPYLKPRDDGWVWFSILDHTCGEHGSKYFKIHPDGKDFLITDDHFDYAWFGTLEEALRDIAKNYWYQGGPETDDDW